MERARNWAGSIFVAFFFSRIKQKLIYTMSYKDPCMWEGEAGGTPRNSWCSVWFSFQTTKAGCLQKRQIHVFHKAPYFFGGVALRGKPKGPLFFLDGFF